MERPARNCAAAGTTAPARSLPEAEQRTILVWRLTRPPRTSLEGLGTIAGSWPADETTLLDLGPEASESVDEWPHADPMAWDPGRMFLGRIGWEFAPPPGESSAPHLRSRCEASAQRFPAHHDGKPCLSLAIEPTSLTRLEFARTPSVLCSQTVPPAAQSESWRSRPVLREPGRRLLRNEISAESS